MTFGDDHVHAQAPDHGISAEAGALPAVAGAYPAPGEMLCWEGRPTPWRAARYGGLGFLLKLPTLVAAAFTSWFLLSTGQGNSSTVASFVAQTILVIGWWGFLPAFFWYKARRLRYVITNLRLLAITPDKPDGEWQLPLGRIDRIERRDHANGIVTLVLLAGGLSSNSLILHGIDQPDSAISALSVPNDRVGHGPRRPPLALAGADILSVLRETLERGERLLWSGQPSFRESLREIAFDFAPITLLAIPVALLTLWILPIGGLLTRESDFDFVRGVLSGILFVALNGATLVGGLILPMLMLWRAVTSAVAVTDQRILIAQGWRRVTLLSLYSGDVSSVQTRHTHENGQGSLLIYLKGRAALEVSSRAFHGVADATAAETAIDALLVRQ